MINDERPVAWPDPMTDEETELLQLWWQTLPPTTTPALADLAFFFRDGRPWQVMMVAAIDPLRVIGACPMIGSVAERSLDEYLALGWQLKGYRVMPTDQQGLPGVSP